MQKLNHLGFGWSCRRTDVLTSFAQTKDFRHDPESDAFKKLDASKRLEVSKSDAARQEELLKWFRHTPAMFWTRNCVDHNGFFGIHTSSENGATSSMTAVSSPEHSSASSSTAQTGTPLPGGPAEVGQKTVSTYFRLIVKMLELPEANGHAPVSSTLNKTVYRWHEMGFLSFSSDSRSTILCFDVPDDVITGIRETMSASTEQYRGPFGLHIPLLEGLVKLYDRSVWAMAKKVRQIEKVS